MKKHILVFLFIASIVGHAQVCKTVIATFQKSGTWGEWTGLIFTKENGEEMRFLNTTNDEVKIERFWQDRDVTQDPEDVAGELHTMKSTVGKRYLINYTSKAVEYKGMDEDGAQTIYENVIVTFEPLGGDNINGTLFKLFQDGELKAVGFGATLYQINADGKKTSEIKVQNKNEICRGGNCVKTVIEKDLTIHTIVLPDMNAKSLRAKVDGKEILKWETSYQGGGKYVSRGIRYSGDLQQAAMALLIYSWFQ